MKDREILLKHSLQVLDVKHVEPVRMKFKEKSSKSRRAHLVLVADTELLNKSLGECAANRTHSRECKSKIAWKRVEERLRPALI